MRSGKSVNVRVLLSHGLVGRGGDAVQIQAIAEAFRSLGGEVEVVGPHALHPYETGTAAGLLRSRLRRLPWWAKDLMELSLNVRLLMKDRRALGQAPFDLVVHWAGIYDFVGVRLIDAGPCPVVAFLDAPYAVERAFLNEGHFAGLHRRCMRELGRRARLLVTVSRSSHEYYAGMGIPPEKIAVIPNGTSARLLQKGLELSNARAPLPGGGSTVIGFVGSLSRWHRVDLLMEAVRLLGQENGWHLLIVGYGQEYAKLRELARRMGLERQVRWTGGLSHDDAFEQIAHFDIAVLPNTLPTGSPMKLFEYAALGRPTVAPDLPNLRDLFDGDEIHFVPPGDPWALAETIRDLRNNPEAARELGRRAQLRVQEYTWERWAVRVLEAVGLPA